MKSLTKLTLSAAFISVSGLASADISNNPNPYAPGFGFDAPHEASWGGWTRGDAGTLYAEWDTFSDVSYPGPRTAAPDVGRANTTDAYARWNPGVFIAGSGNLYSFTVPQSYTFSVTGNVGVGPIIRAALQFETWAQQMDYASIALNGLAPTHSESTYIDPNYPSPFGPVPLVQYLAIWDLPAELGTYNFTFNSTRPHQSLAQVSVDIAAVPVPGAVWLMGSALVSLLGWRRNAPVSLSA